MIYRILSCSLLALLGFGCATTPTRIKSDQEDKFFKSPYVRRCLQYEKEKMVSQAEACWQQLIERLEAEPQFVQQAELTAEDVERIRRSASASQKKAQRLNQELQACLQPASRPRAQRIACLEKFLAQHQQQLTYSEKYDVQSAIAAMKQAQSLEQGEVESTLEHAGKLLGLSLYGEPLGIRIEKVDASPARDCGLREQGLILMIDADPVAQLETGERISRLEACSGAPLRFLVRYGEMDPVEFQLVELSCGQPARCRMLKQHQLPTESCTEEKDPELSLGLSWCYLAADGLLEVERVCTDSPAARAGLRPGQRIDAIDGRLLLGLSREEVGHLLDAFPGRALNLHTRGGALEAPLPLVGPALDGDRAARCWRSIKSSLEEK
jgi:C-terminal processing protease CtpA/Prc